MYSPPFRLCNTVLVLLMLLVVLLPCRGNGALAGTGKVRALALPSSGPTDPHELERFLDQVLGAQLAKRHIPGATVSVVKDGRLFFAKGYGYADLQHGTRVNAETTLFRIASVSKLMVWTAVMQLVERGKLDLHTDINRYLKTFQIPATYPQPITMAHLLTHSAGFEERNTGYSARTPQELELLGKWLATHIPARVRPPGELASYSNYGADLAAYIVEQISGTPFDQYIEEQVYRPLNMIHSTFRQPVPSDLQPHLSQGYKYTDGVNHAEPFNYMQDAPDGAMSSSATDMANFMLAHLQNGRFNNQRILQEATAREMHQQHFTADPRLPGIAYGFYETPINGLNLITHGGDIATFHSLLSLLPVQQMGLFVSYNGSGGVGAGAELLQAFLDHYFPVPKEQNAPPQLAGFAERANQITGTYWPVRRNNTTYEKLFALFEPVEVSNAENGHLTVTISGTDGMLLNLVEVSSRVFQQVGKTNMLVFFQAHPEGTIMFLGEALASYQKVAWYDTRTFQYALLLVCALLFLSALLLWPLQLRSARRQRRTHPPQTGSRLARWLAGIVCLVNLIILGTLLVLILTEQVTDIQYGVPPWLVAIFILALVSALLTIGVLLCTLLAWGKHWWGTTSRIHYTLVALAALAFVIELAYWNLLSFRA